MSTSDFSHFLSRLIPRREPAWKRALHRMDPRELDWRELAHRVDPRELDLDRLRRRAEGRLDQGKSLFGCAAGAAREQLEEAVHRFDDARRNVDLGSVKEQVGSRVSDGISNVDLSGIRSRVESGVAGARDHLSDVRPCLDRARRHLPERFGGLPEETFGDKLAAELRERWWLYAGVAVGATVAVGYLNRRQSRAARPSPPVASGVDLERFCGTWQELARYPQVFQANCASATAEYTLEEDGTLKVRNICLDENGEETRSIEGSAEVMDSITNARLEVRFDRWWQAFVPSGGHGNYWIHWVSGDYRFAIVGNRDRSALWVLGRDTEVGAEEWRGVIERVEQLGYDSQRLERDAHTWVRGS